MEQQEKDVRKEEEKENSRLIEEETTIYEVDLECLSCRLSQKMDKSSRV